MLGALTGFLYSSAEDQANLYKVGQHTVRLLMAVGDLLVGWLLLRQADVAQTALAGEVAEKDKAFYEGKVGAARFFARTVLPRLTGERKIVENADNVLMELSENAF
jgi:hypothetical protein